ncbi:HNH endonuclease signature motif containing protein [Actinoallomurus soli]|uniref:HNH endonuclease signature motif containing protein n=1 Tax=Actinoallomurus soli TaxID=2952535 RepID=UPI0020927EAF|nr:HNH endonuclease signature motif containing protein [Actinoallomurus soli]MCO5968922.1 HNH endonuclease [Actinoallomurus soli]
MALTDITREAVLAAIAEFDRLGRDAFLEKYGFDSSRRYWLLHDGARYDSKAIAGAAHGHLPGRSPLAAKEFSGGRDHAVTVLRRLGFEVTSAPNGDSSSFQTADEIASAIGDLRPASASGKPMLKQAVVLLWAIGRARAGQDRLLGWADTVAALSPLLQAYRRDGESRHGRPDYPIAALFNAGLWDLPGRTDVPRAHGTAAWAWFAEQEPEGGLPEFVYALARRSGPARVRMIDAIAARFFDDFDESGLLTAVGLYDEGVAADEAPPRGSSDQETARGRSPEAARSDYARLCELVARRETRTHGQRRTRIAGDPIRIGVARRAVLLRSEGRCENPGCAKPAPDRNDRGEPLLEVDHVEQLADGGRDHPVQMIALCPDCHRVKTHGQSRHQLIPVLTQRARELHDQWMCTGG